MIACNHIFKSFPVGFLRRKQKIALNGVNLKVNRNEVYGIVGLNGAGKSTLLKILMGFIRQDSGTAIITDQPASLDNVRKFIGYLPENPCLYPNLTIMDHLEFACRIGGLNAKFRKKQAHSVLQAVGLADVANTPIKRFSKGMVQRAALAYALFLDPEILILDEPMSGLDPLGRQLVIDIIADYKKKGSTILFCSHILTDVERICDRVGIMHRGNIVTTVSPPITQSARENPFSTEFDRSPLESLFLQTVQTTTL